MMRFASVLTVGLAVFALPVVAQDGQASTAPAGELRVLDKITGTVTDLELRAGESRTLGHLTVQLIECRYPAANPAGDAFALLDIHYRDLPDSVFTGWMIASSPALNAMDNPRYDVWPLRCITS